MLITEVIQMLEEAKEEYGDITVYIDEDYGQRPVERDDNPLCLCPKYEKATKTLPERVMI
jgi:hypothetical protein